MSGSNPERFPAPRQEVHKIPSTNLEIVLRTWYLGPGETQGWRYGVAYYAQGNGKLQWRQRGTEEVFRDEGEARARANAMWATGLAGEGPAA